VSTAVATLLMCMFWRGATTGMAHRSWDA